MINVIEDLTLKDGLKVIELTEGEAGYAIRFKYTTVFLYKEHLEFIKNRIEEILDANVKN